MKGSAVVCEPFTLSSSQTGKLCGDLRYPADAPGPVQTIVICHSFMAFKDWGFFPVVAELLAEAGYASVIFNFSQNGVSCGGNRITDFDAFRENTFSRELADLTDVLDGISRGDIGKGIIEGKNPVLLGHSRGGGIAILQAAGDARVRGLATWSAISTFDRWTEHQKVLWRAQGYLPLAREVPASPLRLGLGLLNDLETHHNRLSVLSAASRIRVPWLILHGKADITVSPREAEALAGASGSASTTLTLLERTGHLFNARSEVEDHYRTLNGVLAVTITWLKENFS